MSGSWWTDPFYVLEPNQRVERCDVCHSEGFIEHGHPNAPHPDWVERCEACDGTGAIVVDLLPITIDDMDEEDMEQAA